MCPDKGLFNTFKEVQGIKVFMRNDHPHKKMETRTLKLKMYDGVICTISVLYIPDLKSSFFGCLKNERAQDCAKGSFRSISSDKGKEKKVTSISFRVAL